MNIYKQLLESVIASRCLRWLHLLVSIWSLHKSFDCTLVHT